MTLGQNIARLRAEKRLSQGELADALDVSRQSISKWETDASVPELEKLVKLSALFEVSLDELVKGASAEKKSEEPTAAVNDTAAQNDLGTQHIVGSIFLGLGALLSLILMLYGGVVLGLIFGLPFFICGLICLLCKRPVALWCGWALYLCADSYLRYGTGLTWRVVLQTLQWEASWNYMRLFIGWCQFLVMLLMIFCTLRAYRAYMPKKQNTKLLALGWAIYGALCFLPPWIRQRLIAKMGAQFFYTFYNYSPIGSLVETLLSYVCLALLCFLLVRTLAWLRMKKQEKDC